MPLTHEIKTGPFSYLSNFVNVAEGDNIHYRFELTRMQFVGIKISLTLLLKRRAVTVHATDKFFLSAFLAFLSAKVWNRCLSRLQSLHGLTALDTRSNAI